MAQLVTATTAEALEEALIRRIRGIVPTAVKYRDQPWTPEEDNRARATSLQCRAFVVLIAPGVDVDGGLTGLSDVETEVQAIVQVDYRTVPREHLGTVVAQDSQDLADRLEDSMHPVITGMTRSEYLGEEFVEEEDLHRVAYTFAVSYQRPRRIT